MKILQQLSIIFAVCLAGEAISAVLPFPFPGSVISMIVLFLLLTMGAVKAAHIQETADFFQKNMAFFFIPPSVGIMQNLPMLKEIWLPLLLICLITTVITFAVTAWTAQIVIMLQNKLTKKSGKDADVTGAREESV